MKKPAKHLLAMSFLKTKLAEAIIFLSAFFLFGAANAWAQTTKEFIEGSETLVVYADVPGLAPSEFYTIKVRSAATQWVWVECYANITRSLWSSSAATGNNRENYWDELKDWSHTYSNIEMSNGSQVEVQIAAKNGFKIKGSNFTKAMAHPAHKASIPTVVSNIVYFTIDNPGQITIDINGQMDDTNTGNGYAGPAVHTVSLFANPVMVKPSLTDPSVQVVEPGVKPSSNLGTKTTLYFKPGVHDIGRNFTIFKNKKYYIPGDAVVYGTLANLDATTGSGANIRIYGYGTLSGDRIKHPAYDPHTGGDDSYRLIYSEKATTFVVEGLSLMNGPMHTMKVLSPRSTKNETFAKWLKIVTWRVNGDGLGEVNDVSDTFIRTQDDCVYAKGDRKRCVFWTDANGSIFSMAGMDEANVKPFYIEDIDVIYARNRSVNNNGGRVFAKRSDQEANNTRVNVVFRDIRITDKFETHETFQILSTGPGTSGGGVQTSGGFTGITFKNISSVKPPSATGNRIVGHAGGIWDDITFDNVVLGGKKILKTNDFAAMGPYVTNIKFITGAAPTQYTITASAGSNGSITPNGSTLVNSGANQSYAMAANSGYEVDSVTVNGISQGAVTAYTFTNVTTNQSISATFKLIEFAPAVLVITPWTSGTTLNKVSGSNRLLAVMVMGEHGSIDFSATNVTYGGQVMTKQAEKIIGTGSRTYAAIFTLNEAGVQSAASGTITVGWSSAPVGFDICSVLLGNVDQAAPISAKATNSLTGTSIATTPLAAASSNLVIMAGATQSDNTQIFNNGFIKHFESTSSSWGDAVGGAKGGTGADETPSFTQSASGRMVICAMVVKSASPGGPSGYESWPLLTTLPIERRGINDRNGPLNLPNFLSYAMGLNPLTATAADLPRFNALDTAAGTVSFRYQRAKNAPGVTLAPMTSTDLVGWQPASILQSTILDDDGQREVIEVKIAAPVEGRLFFTLSASF